MSTFGGSYMSMDVFDDISDRFNRISLHELGNAQLMNRTDTKYLLHSVELPVLLAELHTNYNWLEVDGAIFCPYETIYYDTPKLELYLAHLTGRANRLKIRQRHYAQSNLAFTEVKKKNRRERTEKYRVPCASRIFTDALHSDCLDDASRAFIGQVTAGLPRAVSPEDLSPVLWVGYTRMTFVSKDRTERLTVDLDLAFKSGDSEAGYSDLVIVELKRDGQRHSRFLDLARRENWREGGISKYCLGLISLNSRLRKNRFQPKLRYLEKVLNRRIT